MNLPKPTLPKIGIVLPLENWTFVGNMSFYQFVISDVGNYSRRPVGPGDDPHALRDLRLIE